MKIFLQFVFLEKTFSTKEAALPKVVILLPCSCCPCCTQLRSWRDEVQPCKLSLSWEQWQDQLPVGILLPAVPALVLPECWGPGVGRRSPKCYLQLLGSGLDFN